MGTVVNKSGGEGGFGPLGTGVSPYNGIANSPRPLPIARNQSDTITSSAPTREESGCSACVYAPRYAPVICCPVGELRPHPSYARHKLSVDASKLSCLSERGNLAFCDPIVVTRERIVIDGYARLELAKRKGVPTLNCIERDLTLQQALEELLRVHCQSRGLNDFVRIELALDLEPYFREKALMNQQAGGQDKGLSKLTRAQHVDTRREIARLAGVGSGNVRKVKNVLTHACSSLMQAARTQEVSINLADKWSHKPHVEQKECLRRSRIERGLKRTARNLVAAHSARVSRSARDQQVIKLTDLIELLNDTDSIEIEMLDAPGRMIFVTKELIDSLIPQGVLVR
jgi:hypothetical protein